MLDGYRVVDLTDHRGQLAGAILAALGAEVVLVEPPGGTPARRRPPLDRTGRSLEFWAHNRGKHSVVAASEDELHALVRTADVLIDSATPGDGPNHEELAALNPALVHVSITPFGSTGPKARWAASDLVIAAAGCWLSLNGDPDRPPVRTSVAQSWLHASGEAAYGALLGLAQRDRSGLGQHVDVSAQIAVMQAAIPGVLYVPNDNPPLGRTAGGIAVGRFKLQFVFPACDGYVSITLLFGDTIGRFTKRLVDWVLDEIPGFDALQDIDWVGFGNRLFADPDAPALLELAKVAITRLTSTRTRAELFAEAQRRTLLLAPVTTPAELVRDEHLQARGYWDTVADPDLGDVVAPGPFAQLSHGSLVRLGPPPVLGSGSAGLDPTRTPAVPAGAQVQRADDLPLAGLRVVDLTWVYAGPLATRVLADYGATVLKVEGMGRPDASRGGSATLRGDFGPEGAVPFGHFNAGKLGVTLDLTTAAAREVLVDLARWADVVIESYTPGTMDAWGIGWERLSAENPRLVMLSTSLMGQTGPLASFAGFGNLAGAITGFYELTGWPDRSPAGPFLAYTDYVAPRFTLAALLAVLRGRDRSGVGCHIDFSQAEAAIHHVATAVLEYTVNGDEVGRIGNADRFAAPHGVYPAAGDDRWVAVVCESDEQWQALAGAMGRARPREALARGATGPPGRARPPRRRLDRTAGRGRCRGHAPGRRGAGSPGAEQRGMLDRPAAAAPRALARRGPSRARTRRHRGLPCAPLPYPGRADPLRPHARRAQRRSAARHPRLRRRQDRRVGDRRRNRLIWSAPAQLR